MERCRSGLTWSVLSAPSGRSYRQQAGRVSWAGVTEKQDLTSTSHADQSLKLILILCVPRCVLQQEQTIFMGLVKTNPKQSGLKTAPSCTKLKENPKVTKVQPWCVIKWKDHTYCNSNKFWGRERQHSTSAQFQMKFMMVAQADAKGQTQHLAHEQSQCTETSSQDINGISNLQTSDTQLASCEHLTSVTTYPPHALISLYCLHLGRT